MPLAEAAARNPPGYGPLLILLPGSLARCWPEPPEAPLLLMRPRPADEG